MSARSATAKSGSHRMSSAQPRRILGSCPERGRGPPAHGRPTRHRKDDRMSPNVTVGYMAEQINRERLDSVAARGWQADQAAATRSRRTGTALVRANLGAALVRVGERIQGMAQSTGTPVDPTALAAR